MVATCKLCQKTAELRYSHIIPELCHKRLYDSKHRAIRLEPKQDRTRYIQKGIRDYLLCDCCEGRLNKIETAFDRYWYLGPALPEQVPGQVHWIAGFDYTVFKLFHLSITWRASVSGLREFKAVSLGPYEEKLRCMILSGDPGQPGHFPLIGQVLVDPDEGSSVVFGLVSMPHKSRLEECHSYLTCYAGCEWAFFVSDHPSKELHGLREFTPRPAGSMLLRVRDYRQSNTVKGLLAACRRRR